MSKIERLLKMARRGHSTVLVTMLLSLLLVMLVSPVEAEWWSTPTQLTKNTAWDEFPSISSDGSKIAFDSDLDGDPEIFVVNSDGSGLKQLTSNTALDGVPSISGDGSKIAFQSDVDGDWEIFVVNSDGSGLKQLTSNTAWDMDPSISGDGSKIAFRSNLGGDDEEIFVVNSDGSGLKQLTSNTAYDGWPSISGDGSKIAFHSNLDGDYEIFVVNSDGSGLKQLTSNTAYDGYPSISGDGNKIAFYSYLDGDWEIFVVNSDGSGLKQLTSNTAADVLPSISGDGNKIAFYSDLDGDPEIFVVNSDGSGLKQLTSNTAADEFPSISGDGSKIAFQSDVDGDWEIFVVSQDVNAPVTVDDYSDQWHTTDFTITLEATDDLSGVAETYYKVNNGPTKNVRANGQPSITTEGANNKLEYWSVDNAGNEETHHVLTGIKLDKNPPTGSIKIAGDAEYTTTTSVQLTSSATDATSGVANMRFSNDGTSWSAWEPYAASKSWTLTTGDGTKTVYVQFRDNAGLTSPSYQDSIILDTLPPSITLTVPLSNGTEIKSSTYTISWTATDAGSGIDHYEVRLDSGTWTNIGTATTHTFTGLGDGGHTFEIKAVDKAGLSKICSVNVIVSTGLTSSIISISVSPTTVTVGGNIIIGGSISPVRAGVTVTIQSRPSGGSWTTLATVVTDAEGNYAYTWTPEAVGTYEVRARWGGDAQTQADESDIKIVTVQAASTKMSSTITLSLSSTSVPIGNSIVIEGSISPVRGGVTVTIQYRPSGGSWSTLTTVITDAAGSYTYTWTPSTQGTYEVKTRWGGDATTQPDESDVRTVTVQAAPFPIPMELLIGLVGAGAAAVALVAYLKKRPKKPKKPQPSGLKISADPREILADGKATSDLTIELVDAEGNPISTEEDREVSLSTTEGRIAGSVAIPKGRSSVRTALTSSTTIGIVAVSASSRDLRGARTEVTFKEKKRYCMHCGQRMPLDARICPSCGNIPPSGVDTKVCRNCKSIIPIVAKFCSECGAGQPT